MKVKNSDNVASEKSVVKAALTRVNTKIQVEKKEIFYSKPYHFAEDCLEPTPVDLQGQSHVDVKKL